jgi:hypothetical protein
MPDSKSEDEREAETSALIARLLDPNDVYDAHHGTDRSPESLAWVESHDPETFARVTQKIAEGK